MMALIAIIGLLVFGFGFYAVGGWPALAVYLGFLLFSHVVVIVEKQLEDQK